MDLVMFNRLCWREFRATRSFTLAMALLSAALLWTFFEMNQWWNWGDRGEGVAFIAFAMPFIHLLALTATAFNREHDAGTFAWLRGLPSKLPQIWISKVAVPGLASATMLLLLVGVSRLLVGSWEGQYLSIHGKSSRTGAADVAEFLSILTWQELSFLLLFAALVIFVSSAVSLGIRRPLTAVIMAGGVCFLSVVLILSVTPRAELTFQVLLYACIVVLAMIANGILAPHWFQLPNRWQRQASPHTQWKAAIFAQMGSSRSQFATVLTRLIWSSRQSLYIVSGQYAVGILLLCALPRDPAMEIWNLILAGIATVYFGGTLFQEEKSSPKGQLLIQHGVAPSQLFWLRLSLALVIGAAITTGAIGVGFISMSGVIEREYEILNHEILIRTAPLILLMITAGMFVSLNLASPLLALAAAASCAIVIAILWAVSVAILLPNWLVILPTIPILVATRARMAPSLLNRNDWRSWTPAITALSIGALLCWSTVYAYRIHIPANPAPVKGNWPTEAFDRDAAHLINLAAEKTTASIRESRYADSRDAVRQRSNQAIAWPLYCEYHHEYQCDPVERHWWDVNRDLLTPELDEAIVSARGLSSVEEQVRNPHQVNHLPRLVDLYLIRAKLEMADGKTSEAWTTYQLAVQLNAQPIFGGTPLERMSAGLNEEQILHEIAFWAANSRVTEENVDHARAWLEAFWRTLPAFGHSLQVGEAIDQAVLDHLLEEQPMTSDATTLVAARRFLPGERLRAERALVFLYNEAQMSVETIEASDLSPVAKLWRFNKDRAELQRTTPTLWAAMHLNEVSQSWQEFVVQARRDANLLRLRLIAYHHHAGKYPSNQAEMQPIWDQAQIKRPLTYTPSLLGREFPAQPVADCLGVLDVHGAAAVLDEDLRMGADTNWGSQLVLPLPVMDPTPIAWPNEANPSQSERPGQTPTSSVNPTPESFFEPITPAPSDADASDSDSEQNPADRLDPADSDLGSCHFFDFVFLQQAV